MIQHAEPLPEGAARLVCVAVRTETPNAKSYTFTTIEGRAPDLDPGQFLNLIFRINGQDVLRSYSVSSSAHRAERLTITVKRVENGLVSNWLFDNLKVGDEVVSLGAAGVFSCGTAQGGPLLLLTAGSGITPAAAMLRSMIDSGLDRDLVLLHFATERDESIFHDEMAHWARNLPRARIIPVMTRPAPLSGWVGASGRLSEPLLAGLVPDVATRHVFCCGPAGFMETARTIARAVGVSDDRFITESFETGQDVDDGGEAGPISDGFMVSFTKSGKEVHCDAASTVLKAAKAADVRILSSCNKGVCGTCRVKLVSGTVEINHQGGIRQREIDQGYILACCSRPTSNISVDR